MRFPILMILLGASTLLLAQERHAVEGAASSPVKVIIYEDLQCSDCADFRRMLDEKLLPRYGDRVTFEHRDFRFPSIRGREKDRSLRGSLERRTTSSASSSGNTR